MHRKAPAEAVVFLVMVMVIDISMGRVVSRPARIWQGGSTLAGRFTLPAAVPISPAMSRMAPARFGQTRRTRISSPAL